MNVTVKLFAAARQAVDQECIAVDLADRASIDELKNAIAEQYPSLERFIPHALFSVNAAYAPKTQTISEDDEIALIPPVSGG